MFKRLVNEICVDLIIMPEGPMLIKSGVAQVSGLDMAWVRTKRNGVTQVYLPGSSLKGMIRAHSERIAKTLCQHATCNPFGDKDAEAQSCGEALNDLNALRKKSASEVKSPEAYHRSCLICRTFGNTFIMGRAATEDAYVQGDLPSLEQRDGVGIDRFTGGSSRGAKFEMEVITGGAFATKLHLQNFELWQMGLLGFVLQDMKDGLIRMGFAKSRGLGKIRAQIGTVSLDYIGLKSERPTLQDGVFNLYGAGSLFEEHESYGMEANDTLTFSADRITEQSSEFKALRRKYSLPFDALPWQELAARWVNKAEAAIDELADHRTGRRRA